MIKSVAEAFEGNQFKPLIKRLLCLFGFIAFILAVRQLPVVDDLETWLKSFQRGGAASMILFVLVGAILVLFFLPVSLVVGSAGFVFGWKWGFVVASAVILLGLASGFWLGRLLWSRISHWPLFRQKTFQAIRKAIETEGNGLICLIRMTPFLHFMSGNLFFGSLSLRFWPYLGFSFLGAIPGTLLMVYTGHLAAATVTRKEGLEFWHLGLLVFGLVLLLGLSIRITRKTRRILKG